MKYYIYTILLILSFSDCSRAQTTDKAESKTDKETSELSPISDKTQILIGDSINGNFTGNKGADTAVLRVIKEGILGEEPWTLAVVFPDSDIPPIEFSCDRDYSLLINEGDLNDIPGDEITIYSPPFGGCTYHMTTYSFIENKWIIVVPTFLISTACEPLSYEELQDRIFKENGNIYYYDMDLESRSLIKVKVE